MTVEIVMVSDGSIVLPANPALQHFTDTRFGINEANNGLWILFANALSLVGRQADVY